MTSPCPACGAEVTFKSSASVSAVCPYCSSLLVRRDLELESLGKMAKLPPDLSPFQLGTSGRFEGSAFQLIGRLRIGYSDGSWNEWYAYFDDGREGWLAEAQGSYMMSFRRDSTSKLPPRANLRPGERLLLEGVEAGEFTVDDIKEVSCIASEGELPIAAPQGRKSTSIDLSTQTGRFATIEYGDTETRLFIGKYVEFDELQLKNLRELDGW